MVLVLGGIVLAIVLLIVLLFAVGALPGGRSKSSTNTATSTTNSTSGTGNTSTTNNTTQQKDGSSGTGDTKTTDGNTSQQQDGSLGTGTSSKSDTSTQKQNDTSTTSGTTDQAPQDASLDFTLSGKVNVHYEEWNSGKGNVVSMTLYEPVECEFTYKGSSYTKTVREVELAFEGQDDYTKWASLEGAVVTITSDGLVDAIHDAGARGVDALAQNDKLV